MIVAEHARVCLGSTSLAGRHAPDVGSLGKSYQIGFQTKRACTRVSPLRIPVSLAPSRAAIPCLREGACGCAHMRRNTGDDGLAPYDGLRSCPAVGTEACDPAGSTSMRPPAWARCNMPLDAYATLFSIPSMPIKTGPRPYKSCYVGGCSLRCVVPAGASNMIASTSPDA